jgi:hypothetical protein
MRSVDERLVADIKQKHRARWFWIKYQLASDRMLESFVRINATDWQWDLGAAERAKINREVKDKIARIGKGKDLTALYAPEVMLLQAHVAPIKRRRKKLEDEMEELAMQLPVWPWVKAIPGFGALGLATIVAEAGDLSNYINKGKLRRRLGLAPHDGHALSTWMRETWRPRALSKDEWTALGYSPNRYARMAQIGKALWFKQWIGKGKSEDGVGRPSGHYGEIYANRRAHTEAAHSDWTPGHRQADAMRVMVQKLVDDLWQTWNAAEPKAQPVKRTSEGCSVNFRCGRQSLCAPRGH